MSCLVTALGVMVGHVGLLPYIFLYVDRPPMSERIDIAMIIGPLTAAYFVSIVRYAIDKGMTDFSADAVKVNLLYVVTSLFVVFPFIISIYGLLYMYQNADTNSGSSKAASPSSSFSSEQRSRCTSTACSENPPDGAGSGPPLIATARC